MKNRLLARPTSINLYYFRHVAGVANLKGNVSIKQLIGQDSDAPDVYLAVVWYFADYLGRGVERGATCSAS